MKEVKLALLISARLTARLNALSLALSGSMAHRIRVKDLATCTIVIVWA